MTNFRNFIEMLSLLFEIALTPENPAPKTSARLFSCSNKTKSLPSSLKVRSMR